MVLAGCGGGGGGGNNTVYECDQNVSVHTIMNSWYYWYQDMPSVDPHDYATPQELLDVLTQPEQDLGKHYSYLTTVAEENAFLSNAAYVGFGFSMVVDDNGRLFLRESFDGGPAYVAGMRRGDEITAINGMAVASMTTEQLNDELGPSEAGYTATFDVTHPDAGTDSYEISKAEVDTPVVAHVQTDLGDGDTTYIFFRSFVDPAFDALDQAFAQMKAANDTQLILDLRYNGGGLISVADHLGGLIAGTDHAGTVIAEIDFNDKHQNQNEQFIINAATNTVDVTDLVVITTDGTASASEMIINGLDPHMNVTTVGSTSYGKPVGQSRFTYCDSKILRAVAFKVVNSLDQGEYYTGIPADCAAVDDILNPLGAPAEASVAEALNYLDTGSCSATSVKAQYELAKRVAVQPGGDPLIRDGWDVLTGGAR